MTIDPHKILIRPVVTEKSSRLRENESQQVMFQVNEKASKPMIKKAVEAAFKVKVQGVNTMIVRGKTKTMGRFSGKKANWKKAIVTLMPGQNLDVVEGV